MKKYISNKKFLVVIVLLLVLIISSTLLYKFTPEIERSGYTKSNYFSDNSTSNVKPSLDQEKNLLSYSTSTKNQEPIIKASLTGAPTPLPLYGFNGEATNAPPWSDRTYLDSAASFPLKIIRYPGGTNSNWWDWRTGRMVKQAEMSFELPSKVARVKPRYKVSHDLSDLKILVNRTECQVVFCLNMISKDLEDQISMLQSAQSLGIPVKWVELGNEFYLNGPMQGKKFSNPEEYGKAAEQWILAIKKLFPDIKIAVIGATGIENWNSEVLKNAPDADAIVAHIYPVPKNVIDQSGINFSYIYQSAQNKALRFYFPKKLAVWVTEYNINWANTGKKKGEEKQEIRSYASTWGQALATILLTSAISSSFPLSIALNQSLPGPALDKDNGWRKKPNGIGMDAWLTACSNMNYMQKIDMGMKDYELLGWKFSNNLTGKNSYFLTNFTSKDITVDLSSVVEGGETYKIEFTDKNTSISGIQDVNIENGTLTNKSLKLPPYSIAIIGQQ